MVEQNQKLLIVDDEKGIRDQLAWCFKGEYEVFIAGSRHEAIAALRRHEPAVVTLDLGLPPDGHGVSEGLKTLEEILTLRPSTKVLLITGNQDHDVAVQAIGMGAYDLYEKPINVDSIHLMVDRCFHVYHLESDHRNLYRASNKCTECGIISDHPLMNEVCNMVEKVAPTGVTTLLLGESGTGKEILARAIHRLSDRSDGPFVAINCAAIPETLLESELFGFERGAFTGASHQNIGRIERAHGGTLFLDEVGDLPMSLQPKLLRFLQERVLERLGSQTCIAVDVRIVCATHRPLKEWVERGTFREDLYYRISEMTIPIPPLRERDQDTVLLARMFLLKFSEELKRPVKGFLPDAIEAIAKYHWPGNVREMENAIKRALIIGDAPWICAKDLSLKLIGQDEALPFNLKEVRDQAERDAVTRALSHAGGNVSKTAELLGVTRPTLYNLMEKLHIREKQPA